MVSLILLPWLHTLEFWLEMRCVFGREGWVGTLVNTWASCRERESTDRHAGAVSVCFAYELTNYS